MPAYLAAALPPRWAAQQGLALQTLQCKVRRVRRQVYLSIAASAVLRAHGQRICVRKARAVRTSICIDAHGNLKLMVCKILQEYWAKNNIGQQDT